jgi:hypothetical protein
VSRYSSGVSYNAPTLHDLHQEQGSQLALGVQQRNMLTVDFRCRGDHGLEAKLPRFEPD